MQNIIPACVAAVFGSIFGSFTTMLIWRLHYDEPGICCGRSKCTKCGKVLKIRHLIPIFSWLIQQGKCGFCGAKISPFYPLTEFSFALTFFIFTLKFYGTWFLIPVLIAVLFVLVLFWYDAVFMEVDRRISFVAIAFAFGLAFSREFPLSAFLIGGAVGYAFYAIQYYISKGKWVGAGDAELGLFMGLLLGWKFLILGLFFSYLLALVYALPFLITKKMNRQTKIPMGAFLMPITLLFLYNGYVFWEWYLRVFGW